MARSPLHEYVKSVPFRPFTVTMSSGRHVSVTGPEMIILGKRIDVVAFVDDDGYDRLVSIFHDQINSVDIYDPNQTRPVLDDPPDVPQAPNAG